MGGRLETVAALLEEIGGRPSYARVKAVTDGLDATRTQLSASSGGRWDHVSVSRRIAARTEEPGLHPRRPRQGPAKSARSRRMSLCDACTLPGRCCTGFVLNRADVNEARIPLEVYVWLASVRHMGGPFVHQPQGLSLPFMPLWRTPSGIWRWCPALDRQGRCSSYDQRPEPCWGFEPGSDNLCVMFRPCEAAAAIDPWVIKKEDLLPLHATPHRGVA